MISASLCGYFAQEGVLMLLRVRIIISSTLRKAIYDVRIVPGQMQIFGEKPQRKAGYRCQSAADKSLFGYQTGGNIFSRIICPKFGGDIKNAASYWHATAQKTINYTSVMVNLCIIWAPFEIMFF